MYGLVSSKLNGTNMSKITMYTTAICPYCVAAKNLLKARGLSWDEVRVDNDAARREEMVALSGRRSVPQIFLDQQHIGGYEDLVEFDRNGGFAKLLAGDAP